MKNVKELDVILKALAEPFPENLLQHRTVSGTNVTSIGWPDVIDRLDTVYPYWSNRITDPFFTELGVSVTATIILLFVNNDGVVLEISRSDVGYITYTDKGYGDIASRAVAKALKRTAAKWGIGRYLYQEDDDTHAAKPIPHGYSNNYYTTPAATANGDVKMASPGQQKALFAISKQKGIDLKDFCRGKKTSELTMAEASQLIDAANK